MVEDGTVDVVMARVVFFVEEVARVVEVVVAGRVGIGVGLAVEVVVVVVRAVELVDFSPFL